MYSCINGWTKKKMLAVIRARKSTKPAYDSCGAVCMYLTPDGNKCGVGLFIPDGHEGPSFVGDSSDLLIVYPYLADYMPLNKNGLRKFQRSHDRESEPKNKKFKGNAKSAMIDWVKKNVKD